MPLLHLKKKRSSMSIEFCDWVQPTYSLMQKEGNSTNLKLKKKGQSVLEKKGEAILIRETKLK